MQGKVVVITGAGKGIGAAAARAFAAAGAQVVVTARSLNAAQAVAAQIGEGALGLQCDVAQFDQVAATLAETVAAFGRLDVLVNNAAVITPIVSLAQADPGDWGQSLDINLKGVFHGMRAALPGMIAQGSGTILTVSSGAAHNPLEGWSAYCTSKAGAAMLTRLADLEARASGVRVLGLSPGTVATDMQTTIRESGVNAVSRLDWSAHIPPDWPARALVWMCGRQADAFLGQEISLRDEGIRRRIGLIP